MIDENVGGEPSQHRGDEDTKARLLKKISPEATTLALVRAGAFLTGYELVKNAIISSLESFFTSGADAYDGRRSAEYERVVLTLGRNPFEASVRWLVREEVLSEDQASSLDDIYAHRHQLAHELARFLVDPERDVNIAHLRQLQEIMRALDNFWGRIDAETSGDYDAADLEDSEMHSGSGLLFDYLLDLAQIGDTR